MGASCDGSSPADNYGCEPAPVPELDGCVARSIDTEWDSGLQIRNLKLIEALDHLGWKNRSIPLLQPPSTGTFDLLCSIEGRR